MNPLSFQQNILMGADPELFIEDSGKIVGSEKYVPEAGIIAPSGGKTVRDGVQVEVHPAPASCRAYFTNNLSYCFKQLVASLKSQSPNATLNFSQVVKLSKEEMDSLSEQSKIFGCAPSNNIYGNEQSKIKVNPKRYLKRSAGGHIHLSSYHNDLPELTAMLRTPDPLIPVLDIILGNTCVLLDRNPNNVERRKVYGKAGEHRIKPYGCEYRTLSNFWIRATPLASMVMGLARFASNLVQQNRTGIANYNYVDTLKSLVSQEKVVQAIQENNFELAMENFSKIESFICECAQNHINSYPINPATIKPFHYFVKRGLDYWFKESPIHHWTVSYHDGHGAGIEAFLQGTVKNDMINNKKDLPEKSIAEIWT